MEREYRVIVFLEGDLPYHLCTSFVPEAAAELVRVLLSADVPQYRKIQLEIGVNLESDRRE